MNIGINLEKSAENLHDALIGRDVIAQKALFVSFYTEFKTDKKVDLEPIDLCKFIFWKLRDGNGVEVFFSDDMFMDKIRTAKRAPNEKPVYLQLSAQTHFGQTISARLKKMLEAISKEKKAPFVLNPLILDKVVVFDLKPEQFIGNVGSFNLQCWEWYKDEKKFSPFTPKEKDFRQFI